MAGTKLGWLVIIFILTGCAYNECERPLDYWNRCECDPKACWPSGYQPRD